MILDTNFYIKFCLEPDEKLLKLIVDKTITAPDFLKLEVINILRKLHFFNGVPREKIDEYEAMIWGLVNEFVPDKILLDLTKKISFQLNHPIYDCIFLALALETNDVFCSYDQRLITKAVTIGIKTIDLTTL